MMMVQRAFDNITQMIRDSENSMTDAIKTLGKRGLTAVVGIRRQERGNCRLCDHRTRLLAATGVILETQRDICIEIDGQPFLFMGPLRFVSRSRHASQLHAVAGGQRDPSRHQPHLADLRPARGGITLRFIGIRIEFIGGSSHRVRRDILMPL